MIRWMDWMDQARDSVLQPVVCSAVCSPGPVHAVPSGLGLLYLPLLLLSADAAAAVNSVLFVQWKDMHVDHTCKHHSPR